MEFTAQQVAELLNGTVEGNPQIKVNRLAKIEEGTEGALSFLANPKYEDFLYSTKASVVIIKSDFTLQKSIDTTLIRVADPYKSFAKLLDAYNQLRPQKIGREQPHFIDPSAQVADDVYVGAFVYIGANAKVGAGTKLFPGVYIGENVSIGQQCTFYAGVKVYHDCVVGNKCTFHSGVVIGGDGFGFAPQDEANYIKVAQIGNVVVHDHVEIGCNTTVDRATLGATIIHRGVKLDNLIQIAHNVEIGEHTVIAAQTGIAGSTKIGRFCMIGGQVGIVGHITIADKVKIAAQSGIGTSITQEGEIVQGSPAFNNAEYKKSYLGFRKLPEILTRLEDLERKTTNLDS